MSEEPEEGRLVGLIREGRVSEEKGWSVGHLQSKQEGMDEEGYGHPPSMAPT